MTSRPAWPRLVPALLILPSACGSTPGPQPIPVLAEQRQCPAFPVPPKELLRPPVKTDFLGPTD